MNDEDILDNAPEGATHVDASEVYYKYLGELDYQVWMQEDYWRTMPNCVIESPNHLRSLTDIKLIVDLRAENETINREQQIKTLESLIGFAWECGMKGQAGDVVWLSDIQDSINKLHQGGEE